MSNNPKRFYEFGPFRLDEEERRLTRDGAEVILSNGKDERLPPKSFDLLLVLVKRPNRMVGREELLEQLWPETFVEDNRLSDNVSTLRKFLGDRAKKSQFIETIPKHGYRFVADVREVTDETIALVEETKARIVIEEEDDQAASPQLARGGTATSPGQWLDPLARNRSKTGWFRVGIVITAVVLVVMLAIAAVLLRNSRGTRSAAAPPLMKTIQLTSFTGNEFDPALSPDGKMVAFSLHDGGRQDIYVKQVGASESLQLTHHAPSRNGGATWSPDGLHIAFIRQPLEVTESGIFIVPSLGGAERELYRLEKLQPNAGLDWAPDGKHIAFTARASAKEPFSIHLLSLETQELRRLTSSRSPSDTDSRMEFSPDGKTIAFVRGDPNGAQELYLAPSAGGEARRLTFDNRNIIGLSWTPDGSHIVFSSNRAGASYTLWKIPSLGGALESVPVGGENALDPHISRTGNRLVFAKSSTDSNIWRIGLPGDPSVRASAPTRLVSSSRHDRNPAISPNGRSIAFESSRTGNLEIWMTDSEGANPVQLTSFGGPAAVNPAWSPDGRQIAFESRTEGRGDISVINPAGGLPRRLTTETTHELSPAWSKDGRWIYFSSDRTGSYQLWKMPSEGGAAVQVTENGGYEAFESADSKSIYYTKFQTPGIYRAPIAGGAETLVLADFPELTSWGDWLAVDTGIYFLDRKNLPLASIRFLDFATSQVRQVAKLEKDLGSHPGLTISPDGRWLVYSRYDSIDYDIMLVENFH